MAPNSINNIKDNKDNNDNDHNQQAVVSCGTSAGPIVIRFTRSWAPRGYDRVVELFERGFYNHSHFFRVVPHYLVQFGISYTENEELKAFAARSILDDPQQDPPIEFDRGLISFAGAFIVY